MGTQAMNPLYCTGFAHLLTHPVRERAAVMEDVTGWIFLTKSFYFCQEVFFLCWNVYLARSAPFGVVHIAFQGDQAGVNFYILGTQVDRLPDAQPGLSHDLQHPRRYRVDRVDPFDNFFCLLW